MNRSVLTIAIIALMFIVGLSVYSNSFKNEFIYDDYHLVVENEGIKNLTYLPEIFKYGQTHFSKSKGGKFYRPITSIVFMIDYFLWALNPFGYHLTNTLLHIVVSALFFVVMRYITRSMLLSFLGGILYLVHPVHTQAVTYISGRADSIATIFLLLMCVFQYKYWVSDKKIIYYPMILLCFCLGLLSKEMAVIFPFLLMIHEYCIRGKRGYSGLLNRHIVFYAPFFVIMGIWFFIKNKIVPTVAMVREIPRFIDQLTMITRMIFDYVRLSFIPINLHMDYRFPPTDRIIENGYLLTWICTIVFLFFLYFIWRKGKTDNNYRIIFFGFGWFMAGLFPYTGILFPLNAIFAEQWLYIPEMGFILSVVYGINYSIRNMEWRMKTVICGCIVTACMFSFLTIKQNRVWESPFTFYSYTLKFTPYSAVMYNNLAIQYIEKKKNYIKAEELLSEAVRIDPEYTPAVDNQCGWGYSRCGPEGSSEGEVIK